MQSPAIKLVILMVGLPARGKSYISQGLARYLNWLGFGTRCFNAGANRRQTAAQEGVDLQSAAFFSARNPDAQLRRDQTARQTMGQLLDWLDESDGHKVGVHDATNTTLRRRQQMAAMVREADGGRDRLHLIAIESICHDPVRLDPTRRRRSA
jgi:hypothetical protein